MKHISLNDNWNITDCTTQACYKASVPASVYSTLIKNGVIPHPFVGMNEKKVLWVAEHEYDFCTKFYVDGESLKNSVAQLVCEGLDTLCNVYVNGIDVGYFCDMHTTHRIDVSKCLKTGENDILIHFYSPLDYIRKKNEENHVTENHDSVPGFSYIRKAHYMFGWDWGPTLPDIGIWKDIYIDFYEKARLDSVYITQLHEADGVTLGFEPQAEVFSDCDIGYEITLTAPTGEKIHEKCRGNHAVKITSPMLWYPNGYGEQPLYEAEITLLCDGKACDKKSYTVGLRKIELVIEPDARGKSFFLRVNGLDVFAKGANYIPEDSFMDNRAQKAKDLLEVCRKCHFNMLRIWGGGIYLDDEFYRMCSENGIMIWQDFMYACSSCVYDEELEKTVSAEVECQLKRLRNYPCFAIWAGNNEIEEMLGYANGNSAQLARERVDYVKMFHTLIPSLMKKYHPQGIFRTSSPTSENCFFEPADPNSGDIHCWSVWHGLKPFSYYRTHLFRFCSEFGFQSIPDLETVKSFAQEEELNLFSPVMEHHQKNGTANKRILSYLADYYRYPTSFEKLVFVSQLMQAQAIEHGVEHWRSNRGECMGSLYWQLNDCWPVISWSSVDYYGRWKALQYFSKRFYAPVLVAAYEENGKVEIAISNDTQRRIDGNVKWSLEDLNGNVVTGGNIDAAVEPLSALKLEPCDISAYIGEDNIRSKLYVRYALFENGKEISCRSLLLTQPKCYSFIKPSISAEINKDERGTYVEIESDTFVKYVRLSSADNGVIFEDNWFELFPGKKRRVYTEKDTNFDELKNGMKIMTLYDTYN